MKQIGHNFSILKHKEPFDIFDRRKARASSVFYVIIHIFAGLSSAFENATWRFRLSSSPPDRCNTRLCGFELKETTNEFTRLYCHATRIRAYVWNAFHYLNAVNRKLSTKDRRLVPWEISELFPAKNSSACFIGQWSRTSTSIKPHKYETFKVSIVIMSSILCLVRTCGDVASAVGDRMNFIVTVDLGMTFFFIHRNESARK